MNTVWWYGLLVILTWDNYSAPLAKSEWILVTCWLMDEGITIHAGLAAFWIMTNLLSSDHELTSDYEYEFGLFPATGWSTLPKKSHSQYLSYLNAE